MKNWIKNLLFVLFSFVFLGIGIFVAQLFIHEKGNPLKDPNFLADATVDSTSAPNSLPIDSTEIWTNDTVQLNKPVTKKKETEKEIFDTEIKSTGDYLIIIGIFGKRSNANREVKKLRAMGYTSAYLFSKLSMDMVSAGQFKKKEAEKIALILKSKGYKTVVKRR